MDPLTSDKEFAAFIHEGRKVVEFYTNWCPDCKRIAPYLDSWAQRFATEYGLATANAEQLEQAAEVYDIQGIPTFLVFENGQMVKRLYSRDAKSKQQVEAFLERAYD